MTDVVCWRCGTGLEQLSLPLSRLDECPECVVHLHVCRMCKNFDPAITKSCSEDDAEEVRDKQAANFCDYFKVAYGPQTHSEKLILIDRQGKVAGYFSAFSGPDLVRFTKKIHELLTAPVEASPMVVPATDGEAAEESGEQFKTNTSTTRKRVDPGKSVHSLARRACISRRNGFCNVL